MPDKHLNFPATCLFPHRPGRFKSGAEGCRTLDLCIANAALSQLSYRPKITIIERVILAPYFLSVQGGRRAPNRFVLMTIGLDHSFHLLECEFKVQAANAQVLLDRQ